VRDAAVTFEVEPPGAATMARRISTTLDMYPWLVAETGAGEIVGYAYAGRHRERPAYCWTIDTTIYIDGAHRRAGVGAKLYGSLLEILRAQGFRSAFAEIVLPNAGSVGLHERLGFAKMVSTTTSVSSSAPGATSAIGAWGSRAARHRNRTRFRFRLFGRARNLQWRSTRMPGPPSPNRP
jgi:L-amino acid N-acyltransferase YncA